MASKDEIIAVIGLGYVGLPVALRFAKAYQTIGFDIDARRIDELRGGHDQTGEVEDDDLAQSTIHFSCDPADLERATFIIVAVPTPIDDNHQPDLRPLVSASRTVGPTLRPGDVVVYESTVYPGVTEDVCAPILQETSGGLVAGRDFKVGYSPERINPGDKEHTFERIIKVVSGEDQATLERVAAVYSSVVHAGVHKAPSIKVAEAAKVIENTQRDLNIALMNELALIFDRIGVRTRDVIDAASTKWNFLPFTPGLVGGHCIGVDPYYLTFKAEELGYLPQVILAGRRINDGMGAYVAQRAIKMMSRAGVAPQRSRVAILGLSFKENVPDLRNSRVPDIVAELAEFGVQPLVHDPLGHADEARDEYGIELAPWDEIHDLDAVVYAVGHRYYKDMGQDALLQRLRPSGVILDVKSNLDPERIPSGMAYWSL